MKKTKQASPMTTLHRCHHRIAFVLAQFEAMGATPDEVASERTELLTNESYYHEWCEELPVWCPTWTEDMEGDDSSSVNGCE